MCELFNENKKENWIIVSGDFEGIHYANIIKKCTKKQVGFYIKNNVKKLFDHFIHMLECDSPFIQDNQEFPIAFFMSEINKKYLKKHNKNIKHPLETHEKNKIINKIERKLQSYDDFDVADYFHADSDGIHNSFVWLSNLSNPSF